jgi:uncharacterized protein with FMN-binding domain
MRDQQAVKKLIVAISIIGMFLIYSFTHARAEPVATTPKVAVGGNTSTPVATVPGGATVTPGATGTSSGRYKDGTYTGPVTDAQWGYVQVQAIIQNGQISDVKWLQFPNERSYSQYVNSIADPQLTTEAVQAQYAQVDIISGATDSSMAFMQSLASALSQAQG